MNWTRLIYGTAILVALTGTAIYYSGNRAVIKPIDIADVVEAGIERMMPFSYRLATNTIIVWDAKWIQDTSTNRWQDGTNMVPYLTIDGVINRTSTFVSIEALAPSWESYAGYGYYEDPSEIPTRENFWVAMYSDNWVCDLVQTGRTLSAEGEYPAYVLVEHPLGVGVWNNKATLDYADNLLLSAIPRYADHEAATNGVYLLTNNIIPMLSASSVWTRLGLPYIWTNINKTVGVSTTNWIDTWTNDVGVATNVTRVGTNMIWNCVTNLSTNYTFTTSQYCTTNMLWERYQVAKYLKWTPGKPSTWTNVTENTWTNIVTSNAYWGVVGPESYTYQIFPLRYYPGCDAVPSYPANWENPLGGPVQSETIDDSEDGVLTTNVTGARPFTSFASHGVYSKTQTGGGQWRDGYNDWPDTIWHSWGSVWSYWYRGDLDCGLTNSLIKRNSEPVVSVPENIAACAVTGDVYFLMSGETNYVRLIEADMTHTGAFEWVGNAISVTNDLMVATNYPYATTIETNFWPSQSSYGTQYWKWFNGVAGDWSTSSNKTITEKLVIFKWSFSRCKE